MNSLSKYKPLKQLKFKLKKNAGRNNQGKITVRHQGGGKKILYRVIDYKRSNLINWVVSIEYDPNRNAFLAKLCDFYTKKYSYIIAPEGLNVFDIIYSKAFFNFRFKTGDCYNIKNIPIGTLIYNIELIPGQGGKLVRSAGTFAKVLYKQTENNVVKIKLPSGHEKFILDSCKVSLGCVSNKEYRFKVIKKAGINRNRNIRPTVRGVAMNPVDHPHGGGEGKTSGGRPSVSLWGWPTKGKKTRKKK